MKVLHQIILASCFMGLSLTQYVGRTTPIHFNCTNNPNTCVDPVCSFTKIDIDRMNVSFGCTLVKSMRKISVRLKEYHLRSKNKWKTTSIDFTFEACQLTKAMKNPLFRMFMPGIMKTLEQFIHPCPYEGRFVAKNITFTSGSFVQMLPKGTKTKAEVILSDIKYMNFATLFMYHQVL